VDSQRGLGRRRRHRLTTDGEILDLIVQASPLADVLRVIALKVEQEIHASKASILVLDDEGRRLHVVAGPSLPPEFLAVMDGVEIGPAVGTCGTAAYRQRAVITSDISLDPAWDSWREFAEAAGVQACWSTPFLGPRELVLGTFAVYFAQPRRPEPAELALLSDAGYLAAVAVQHDAARALLRRQSRTHTLTGLANRVVLVERLREAESAALRSGRCFALIQVAVRGITEINESIGPSAGDEVLRQVARRLVAVAGPDNTVAHLWGLEFAVLAERLERVEDAVELASRVSGALGEAFEAEGVTVLVGATLGVAAYSLDMIEDGFADDEPLRAAGVALERAAAAGDARIGVYDPHADPSGDMVRLAPELRRGLDDHELSLAYQPVVRLSTGRVEHYEALLRWRSPRRGQVSPDSFVPVAEQSGMAGDLGRYALRGALAELAVQRAAGIEVGVAVNLSVRQLSDEGLPALVAQLMAEHRLPAGSVTLEMTEGVLLGGDGSGWESLARLREVGARIALDDFGTGFSQLPYLRQFRFDEIKIDKSFVTDMIDDISAKAIVVATIAFAGVIGADVVAEGVERVEQRDLLLELGCSHGQGYLFGAPAPAGNSPRH
jgi:diguanylate cyclase (GGDEF)-like protein